eukprot:5744967-Pyramimonas_sp.AAC.2
MHAGTGSSCFPTKILNLACVKIAKVKEWHSRCCPQLGGLQRGFRARHEFLATEGHFHVRANRRDGELGLRCMGAISPHWAIMRQVWDRTEIFEASQDPQPDRRTEPRRAAARGRSETRRDSRRGGGPGAG